MNFNCLTFVVKNMARDVSIVAKIPVWNTKGHVLFMSSLKLFKLPSFFEGPVREAREAPGSRLCGPWPSGGW